MGAMFFDWHPDESVAPMGRSCPRRRAGGRERSSQSTGLKRREFRAISFSRIRSGRWRIRACSRR